MTARRLAFVLSFVAGLALAGMPAAASAQQAPDGVTAVVRFTESNATIGDRATLVVRIEHPDSIVVTVPLPEIADAEVLNDGETITSTLPDGRQATETTFLYQLFNLGPIESGPVPVRWIQEDGTGGEFAVPGAQITVLSVRQPGDEALRPLKPPLAIEGAPPAWLLPGAILLGALVLVALAVLGVRRLRRGEPEAEERPVDTPEQSARERLAAVQHARLPEEAEFQRFYGTIAAVVREYLAARFGFNATALTSRSSRHG